MNGDVQRGRLQLASYVLQGAVKLRPGLPLLVVPLVKLYRFRQTMLRHPAVAYVATFSRRVHGVYTFRP